MIYRTVINGKRREIGLGGVALVSLAEAREKALAHRKLARAGGDPLAEKRKSKAHTLTFEAAARKVHEEQKASWRNEKHRQPWINTLRQYAFPIIGDLAIGKIGSPEILNVLSPIWLSKPETARRLRRRLGTVFDWAKAAGYRDGDNPVRGISKGLPKQLAKQEHHAAMPFAEVPAFVARLRAGSETDLSSLALEFLILTAARTSEVLNARRDELDLKQALWIVPASRMKAGREHRLPLAERSLEIIGTAMRLGGTSDLLFPGRSLDNPMPNMVFAMKLRRMQIEVTAHGFRSSFRDWAAEATRYPREVAEMALAHTIENKVEAA
jgi:integrase